MPINFDNPDETTHNGQPIPINTQAKYDAGLAVLNKLYDFYEVEWSETAEAAYEQRVRNGQTLLQIIANTIGEYNERMTNVPGAAPIE